jgi:16S rRNA (adenine1518-N6/adenine1519-N6)-dimethyltransferase
LADRHGIRPKKSLGQHFMIEPSLARRIVELAGIGPTSHAVEVGAGLGSLTLALAESGAEVVAVERDRRLAPALEEVLGDRPGVRVEVVDALRVNWSDLLGHTGPWTMVANLPYNVAVPVMMGVLEGEPSVTRFLVMVQREVGERLTAGPGDPQYGAVSLRVAYRAEAKVARRVPPSVFWPQPGVESVLVSMVRRPPPVDVDEAVLWQVIAVAFAQRRKTMRGALIRLGIAATRAEEILAECGIDPRERPERLGLPEFACLAERWSRSGAEARG